MSIATATTDQLYALRNALIASEKGVESLILTNNSSANLVAAIDTLLANSQVLENAQSNAASKLVVSGASIPCPAPTGTRTTGYIFTVVNGVITAAVGY